MDVAIVDRHITQHPRGARAHKEAEDDFEKEIPGNRESARKIASGLDISQGELDFYLWYLKTGKVLK